ncbi:MAG: type IV pilus assembly protein PilC [Gammaproteobacteria bacterium]|jgi:type IV pilus assembly protein PilC
MELYQYKAIDNIGRVTIGRVDAANVSDLEMRLKKMGLDLVNSKEIKSKSHNVSGRGVKRRDLILFCFHLEQTTRAGVPMLESLEDLRDSTENPGLTEVIAAMSEAIGGGKTLSESMMEYPGVFPKVFSSLVKAGEQSGEINEVFKRLGESLKWEDELASQTKKLIMYPAFVGSVVLLVLFFLMTYLVPELLSFIRTMGSEIPVHTRALIATSDVFVNYWYLIIFTPIAIFTFIKVGCNLSDDIRLKVDTLKLKIPVIGPILEKLILARLAGFFAMMYSSGITIIDCIRTGEEISGNRSVEMAMNSVGQKIAEGHTLSDSFKSTNLFPPLVIRMLRVGESTGALEESLENIGYFYTRDVRESIERLQSMIEPAMTVILGILVGWVMFSILGPIYDLITEIDI